MRKKLPKFVKPFEKATFQKFKIHLKKIEALNFSTFHFLVQSITRLNAFIIGFSFLSNLANGPGTLAPTWLRRCCLRLLYSIL